jgi:hypothetical protein
MTIDEVLAAYLDLERVKFLIDAELPARIARRGRGRSAGR